MRQTTLFRVSEGDMPGLRVKRKPKNEATEKRSRESKCCSSVKGGWRNKYVIEPEVPQRSIN